GGCLLRQADSSRGRSGTRPATRRQEPGRPAWDRQRATSCRKARRIRRNDMRRIPLVLALTIGLVIGTMVPGSALGETSVTLNCSDGTSVRLLVDTDTLTNLTASVQAMIDYPAGLSCSLIQNPLGAFFGHIALADDSPGTSAFIVGGGRWQIPCGPFSVVNGGVLA